MTKFFVIIMKSLENSLVDLGLHKKEVMVYLSLVKGGFSTAAQTAHDTGLPRQTVYSILEKLVNEEFVEQGDKRGVKQFFADPSKVLSIIDKRQHSLETDKRVLEKEMAELLLVQTKNSFFPKIQYYEGRQGLIRLFNNILGQYKKGESKNFRGYGINKMREALGDYLFEFVKKRGEFDIQTRLFIGQGPDDFNITDKESAFGRNVKRLEIKPQNAALYVVGQKVYLFSYPDQVGVMIENKNIADLLKNVFDDHWTKY